MKLHPISLLVMGVLTTGCVARHVERQDITPDSFRALDTALIAGLKTRSPFLKAHMKNGNLYVFDSWSTDDDRRTIAGHASLYTATRETVATRPYSLSLDTVALLESNVLSNSGSANAMTVLTGITAAVTVFCFSNPKACFGSCPTFYVSDGDSLRLQAEGFSSSIAPSLEATDVDALYHASASNGKLLVQMRNEALETHVVRHVQLLVAPRRGGERVFASQDGQFWQSTALIPPASAVAPEGDCLPALIAADGKERFSAADGTNLGAKEEIDIEFPTHPGGTYGLVVGCRQTLLPTYLLYQAFAYMGNDAGHWLAEIERENIGRKEDALEFLVGGIEASIQRADGTRNLMGKIDEHGPLATDIHLIPLGRIDADRSRITLRMTKGAWRIDYVCLAELSGPVTPDRLSPASVRRDDREDPRALALLNGSDRPLVTLPGDTYTLTFALPDGETEYEFFLESRGYYLEWIRKEWIDEQNPFLLAEMFYAPALALTRMAPEFKRVEASMEDSFWRSRYAKP